MARNPECSTRAKRDKLVLRLHAMAALHGAVVDERRDEARETYLRLRHGPYAVSMDLEAGIEGFMGHWHVSYEHGTQETVYPADFGSAIRGPVNTCHHRKASTIETDFDSFMRSLAAGFTRLSQMGVQPVSQEIAA